MRFSGDCCRRHERNGNVCNTATQEKANSAGSRTACSMMQNDQLPLVDAIDHVPERPAGGPECEVEKRADQGCHQGRQMFQPNSA